MGVRKAFLLLIVLGVLTGCSAGRKARTAKIESVIGAARSYIGTPYRYGGVTRSGMDCSGLLVASFHSVDMQVPRTSKEQSRYGKKVNIEGLRPGDVVFFAAKKRRRKVSHAGLVTRVEGNRSVKFIHSSTSLGVVETELYTDYYQSIFVKARRPKY
ncbi:MAG: C40 family peptidase [Cyclobacteriaceae bacterium]|nr:C40 family peptidase [Cyclobacteriaceae bacterium]